MTSLCGFWRQRVSSQWVNEAFLSRSLVRFVRVNFPPLKERETQTIENINTRNENVAVINGVQQVSSWRSGSCSRRRCNCGMKAHARVRGSIACIWMASRVLHSYGINLFRKLVFFSSPPPPPSSSFSERRRREWTGNVNFEGPLTIVSAFLFLSETLPSTSLSSLLRRRRCDVNKLPRRCFHKDVLVII